MATLPALKIGALQLFGALSRRGWLRSRQRLIDSLWPDSSKLDFWFRIKVEDLVYTGNLKFGIDWWVFFYGPFEPALISLCRSLARWLAAEGPVHYVDVGTNVGHHCLLLAKHVATVHGFEPFAYVRESAEAKVKGSGLSNITIFPFGLSDADATEKFYPPATHNTGTGSFLDHAGDNATSPISCDLRRGDTALADLRLEGPVLLKIDVEGFESAVLLGLRSFLDEKRPILLLEVSPTTRVEAKRRGVELESLWYARSAVYRISEDHDGGTFRLLPRVPTDELEMVLIVPQEKVASLEEFLARRAP